MMIGSEKLLPVLAVPAEHQGRALQPCDVKVVGFNVKSGWTAQTVSDALNDGIATVGKPPRYVITDNDHKMCNAVSLSGYVWHRDISHTLAMFMERTYKNDADFVAFNELMHECKQKYCMKDIAYLQAPSQRSKARFMNLSYWVDWAYRMLRIYNTLKKHEKEVFSFIPMYASLINELRDMVSHIHAIEKEMKSNGLSRKTIDSCRRRVQTRIMSGNDRMKQVGRQILDYLTEERNSVKDGEAVNNSSDIIESVLGMFKNMVSPNKQNGITTLILHLPVRLALSGKSITEYYDVRGRLCRTKIQDITNWRNENLMENLVTKRIRTLKVKVG